MKNKKILIIAFISLFILLACCCILFLILIPNIPSNNINVTNTVRNINILDTFDDNRYGWTIGEANNDNANVIRLINNGKYYWSIQSKKTMNQIALSNPSIEKGRNILVSVDINQINASDLVTYNLLGLINDENNFYALKINQKYQQYNIGVYNNGEWTNWVKWTRTPIINYDSINNLKFESNNGKLTFYINNTEVYSQEDYTHTSGAASISVSTYEINDYIELEFDNFKYVKSY